MKRLLLICILLLIPVGAIGAGLGYLFRYDLENQLHSEADLVARWKDELQKQVNAEGPAGVKLQAARADGDAIALEGSIDKESDRSIIEMMGQAHLQERYPRLYRQYPDVVADKLTLSRIQELPALVQIGFADGDALLRLTRIHEVTRASGAEDNPLDFVCVCIDADVDLKPRLEAAIKKQVDHREKSPIRVQVRNHPYPVDSLQKRLNETFTGVTLTAARFDRDGKLRVEGVVADVTKKEDVEKALASVLVQAEFKAIAEKHVIHLVPFDAEAVRTSLETELRKETRTGKKTYLSHISLKSIALAKKEANPKAPAPRYEVKVDAEFLDTAATFPQQQAEAALQAWLKDKIAQSLKATDVDGSDFALRIELHPLGIKVATLQDRIVKRKLDGAVVTDVRFDEKGSIDVIGHADKRDDVKQAIADLLPELAARLNFDKLTRHKSVEDGDLDWSQALQKVSDNLASQKDERYQRARLDRLYFRYLKDKLVLDGDAVVLLEPGQAPPDLHSILAGVIASDEGAKDAASLWKTAPYPLIDLQNRIAANQPHLDGTLLLRLRYDAAGVLQFAGHLGNPNQVEPLRTLLTAYFADDDHKVLVKDGAAWSITQVKLREVSAGKDRTWDQIVNELRTAMSADPSLQHQWLERALYRYRENREKPRTLILQWNAKRVVSPGDTEAKKREEAELKRITELCKKILPRLEFDEIETKYMEIPTPIFRLQKLAVEKNYPGVLFEEASFDAAGKLRFKGVIGDDKQAERLKDDIARELGISPKDVAPFDLRRVPWAEMQQAVHRGFAESVDPLLRQSRLDDLHFEYDDKNTLRLVCRGISVYRNDRMDAKEQDAKLTEALRAHLKKQNLDAHAIMLDIDRTTANPAITLQQDVVMSRLDGVVFRTTGFDDKGVLRVQAFVPKGLDEQVKKLFDELSKKHPKMQIQLAPWVSDRQSKSRPTTPLPIFVSLQEKKVEQKQELFDWSKMLAELQASFSRSTESTFQQTRIDRAYFTLVAGEPDLPPFLHFAGVCLRTALDDEAKMKEALHKELGSTKIPGVKYVLKTEEIVFHESPIYVLQSAAVQAFKQDAGFNNFFEHATYAADSSLQLHVLCLRADKATDSKLAKLLSEHPLKAEVKGAKAAKFVRRDFDWLGKRADLQRQFAGGADVLLQRTRLDDGHLDYSKDRKGVEFHVVGVCVHPPGLVTVAERITRWKKQVSGLIPKVTYVPIVDITMFANPSIAWQDHASGQQSNDGIFFHLAQFDAPGRLSAAVNLPDASQREAALKIVAEKPAPARLGAVDDKTFAFQPWNWKGVILKAQARLAQGDFLEHRTRIDRVFLKYDDVPNGVPFMHFEGVSLHPTEVEKADALRGRLEQSLTELPPTPIEHKLNSKRIEFVDSPIYALQTEAVTKSLDGLLFADGRYDADGKLHLGIVIGTPAQRETSRKMVDALVMPEGVVRPKGAKGQPLLDYTEIAWADVLHQMQRWLARSGESLLKKSRLDRAFFSYPPTKVGPDLNMAIVGIYPKNDALTAHLKKRFDTYVMLSLTDQLRAGPVAVRPVIENLDNPATVVQAKVSEHPVLDGVRLDDTSFDGDGKLILYGIWNSKKQQEPLDKLIRDTLAANHPALKHGINWKSLEEYDSAGLLHSMRVWVAGQEAIDEVWLERIFFDAGGKVRIVGFYTRPSDKEKSLKTLPEFLPRFGSKALPPLEPAAPKAKPEEKKVVPVLFVQEPMDDDPFRLDKLPNIAQYLRDNIPKVTACDGLRIDRCFYDPQGVFRIEGLADHAKHTAELKPFLDDEKAPFDRKRQLAKSWGEGRQTVIALRPMMVSLRENLPSLSEFDGFTLMRAHHDPKNQLVLTGSVIGDADPKEMAEIAERLLKTHPRWRLRTTFGVEIKVTDRKKADRELAEKLTYKALHLVQVNIGEAYIAPLPPSCIGFMSHAWPFDPKLPRIRPTDLDYSQALEYLDGALLNDPKNVLAWYLRGYVLQTRGRSDLTLRDFRRLVEIENEDAEARHHRILDIELVQGVWRQRAYRIEQDALIDVGDGWTLRVLRESPAAPDVQGKGSK